MIDEYCRTPPSPKTMRVRLVGALTAALLIALGVYLLIKAVGSDDGLVGFTFLIVLPAAISALACYVADLDGTREKRDYLLVPLWLMLGVIALSALVLREGVICIVMLTPLWLGSGLLGALATYLVRQRIGRGRTYSIAMLALPLVAMQIEPALPVPVDRFTVSRSIEIDAPAARIWPLLRGIEHVRPGEGTWNVTQDLIGVPRPHGARLIGAGVGAQHLADWGRHIRFRERISQWQVNRRIGWTFQFDDIAGWQFTDRHLMPDSRYFRVEDGGYSLAPLANGKMRLTLDTGYKIATPVNAYAALWGEVFLGDLENNLLAMIKARAERGETER